MCSTIPVGQEHSTALQLSANMWSHHYGVLLWMVANVRVSHVCWPVKVEHLPMCSTIPVGQEHSTALQLGANMWSQKCKVWCVFSLVALCTEWLMFVVLTWTWYLCTDLQCQNGGTFNAGMGICECPIAFTGIDCSGKMSCSFALAWCTTNRASFS